MDEELVEILSTLNGIKDDLEVPKNIRVRITETMGCIGEEKELCLKASQILEELEDITNDPNVPCDVRIEIMNAMSILGKLT